MLRTITAEELDLTNTDRRGTVLFNGDLEGLGCPPEMAQAIRQNGWDVVNAPRPLFGAFITTTLTATWSGPFLHGTFFAAGPREEGMTRGFTRTFGETWTEDDGWEIVLIDNATIETAIRDHAKENGVTPDQLDDWDLGELATMYGLPYVREESGLDCRVD